MDFLLKLLRTESAFDRGVRYATSQLEAGKRAADLLAEADNAFDFGDFDRGILSVCNGMSHHRAEQWTPEELAAMPAADPLVFNKILPGE